MKLNNFTNREITLDVIRSIALYLVISVHFFLNNGFYSQPVVGKTMFIMVIMRTAFMSCVPLFCILTGYLMNQKKITLLYYKGISRTLSIYILASLANLAYTSWALKESFSFNEILTSILNFTAAPYSWYIEMYIGLFLLIPFLNLTFNGLESKKQKQLLLVTLIVLTALPSIINIFNFEIVGWWKNPNISSSYSQLIPSWWTRLWPLTYYFLGAYLKEYTLEISKKCNLYLYILSLFLFGSFNYYRSYNSTFIWGAWTDWYGLPIVILSVLLFSLLLKSIKVKTAWIAVLWIKLSNLSLGAYLVSSIFDKMFYPYLIEMVPNFQDRIFFYPLITILVLVCSLLLSWGLSCIFNMILDIIKILNLKN